MHSTETKLLNDHQHFTNELYLKSLMSTSANINIFITLYIYFFPLVIKK